MESTIPRFMSIREVAKTGLLPEYTLRLMESKSNSHVYMQVKSVVLTLISWVSNLTALPQEEVRQIDYKK